MKNLFLACLFLGSTFGYGAKENKGLTKPKLQIGLVFPFSGSLSRFGDDLLKGFTLAHENLKKENPDLAARVQFIVQDNKGLTSLTEASTLKLIKEQRVHIIFGGLTNFASTSIADLAQHHKKPFISAAANFHRSPQYDYAFNACLMKTNQGQSLGNFAAQYFPESRAVIVTEIDNPFSEKVSRDFIKSFGSSGGQVVGAFDYQAMEEAHDGLVLKIKEKNPDIVLLPGRFSDAKKIIAEARMVGINVPFLGGDRWDDQKYRAQDLDTMTGNYYVSHFDAKEPRPEIAAFSKAYSKKHGTSPGVFAALGYDGFNVIIKAFMKADSNRSTVLRKALANLPCSVLNPSKNQLHAQSAGSGVVMKTTKKGPEFLTRMKF